MTRHTIINIQQIRDDICKRKAMPPFGPDTSINRLKTINETQRSFTLEVVESLLGEIDVLSKSEWTLADELVKAQKRIAEQERTNTAQDDHINQQADRIECLEKQNNDLGKAIRAALPSLSLPPAASDVLAERQRQTSVKGYTTQQDDTYIEGELAAAAISYIEPLAAAEYWPADWHDDSFKPSDYRRNLVKACALLIAEIERIDRQSEGSNDEPRIPD
ncbi:hypothetical protein [Citrobacter freundii]|uniref:hypothetical protein n=1 Tax=Citrobacter freundii TaxID=546 RepID=UPI0039790B53